MIKNKIEYVVGVVQILLMTAVIAAFFETLVYLGFVFTYWSFGEIDWILARGVFVFFMGFGLLCSGAWVADEKVEVKNRKTKKKKN